MDDESDIDRLLAAGQEALRLGRHRQAREALEAAYPLSDALSRSDLRRVAVQCLLGEAWFHTRDWPAPPAALASFGNFLGAIRLAGDRAPDAGEAANRGVGLTFMRLADHCYSADRKAADQYYLYALDMLERSGSPGRLDLAQCLYRLASLRCHPGHRDFLIRARSILAELVSTPGAPAASLAESPMRPHPAAPVETFLPSLTLWDDVIRLLHQLDPAERRLVRDGIRRLCHHLSGYWAP